MSRKVNLRNHGDAELLGISHHLAHIVLGVETAVADAVLLVLRIAVLITYDGLAAPGTHVGELRIGLDFSSPSLVLSKMPVETVELEGGHHIEHLLDFLYGPEMPSAVEVHSAIAETRCILNLAARQHPLLILGRLA